MRYGYNEEDEVLDEEVTITVKCTMRRRWAPQFISMLDRMEYLGSVGSSRKVAIYSDGDGDFRPKFVVDGKFPKVEPSVDGAKYPKDTLFGDGDMLFDAG